MWTNALPWDSFCSISPLIPDRTGCLKSRVVGQGGAGVAGRADVKWIQVEVTGCRILHMSVSSYYNSKWSDKRTLAATGKWNPALYRSFNCWVHVIHYQNMNVKCCFTNSPPAERSSKYVKRKLFCVRCCSEAFNMFWEGHVFQERIWTCCRRVQFKHEAGSLSGVAAGWIWIPNAWITGFYKNRMIQLILCTHMQTGLFCDRLFPPTPVLHTPGKIKYPDKSCSCCLSRPF